MEFLVLLLILGSILWLFYRKSNLTKITGENKILDPVWNEVRALRKDPSQMNSYDPDWVLRHLLKTHPQFFAQRDIKQVLADCIPHDDIRMKEGKVVYFDWYWIVELLPGHSPKNEKRFVYLVGWFDPRLWEPVSHLKAWFFSSKEESLSSAITGFNEGKWKREPDQRLYDFLKKQIMEGEKVKRNPHKYWVAISIPVQDD